MTTNWGNPATDANIYRNLNNLTWRAYHGPMAQAQRLREMQVIIPNIPAQAILSPDAQSQTEIGYTQPIQDFTGGAVISANNLNGPGNVTPTGTQNSQPNLKLPQPSTGIPTGMPWNSL